MSESRCRSCNAPIRWELTAAGKKIPLDPEPPAFGGNLVFRDDGRVVSDHGAPAYLPRYRTHFVTCPNASKHRR